MTNKTGWSSEKRLAKAISKVGGDERGARPNWTRCLKLADAWNDARNRESDADANGMTEMVGAFGTGFRVTREIAAAHLFTSNEDYLYERADEMRVEPIK